MRRDGDFGVRGGVIEDDLPGISLRLVFGSGGGSARYGIAVTRVTHRDV